MTLERVRVHLSERTAGVAGIGFVACTRVRHPWDIVFEEDLPEYEHFMKARRTVAFRERKRFELRQEARASRTLRRYGFCEADLWTKEEASAAEELLKGLKVTASEQRDRMRGQGRIVDVDTWLWGEAEPDYVGELAKEVRRAAGGDAEERKLHERVADRLLDRACVRVATVEECQVASRLLAGMDSEALTREGTLAQCLSARVEELGEDGSGASSEEAHCLARKMADRIALVGRWDERLGDEVDPEIQPLHMSQVREALGSLIPAKLHKSLDKAAARVKDDFGAVRGGSVLFMDSWRLSVRAEDALARGRLQEARWSFSSWLSSGCAGS
jgi:hypothetical protein